MKKKLWEQTKKNKKWLAGKEVSNLALLISSTEDGPRLCVTEE
jgi:hypothetical protein